MGGRDNTIIKGKRDVNDVDRGECLINHKFIYYLWIHQFLTICCCC